MRFKVKFYKHRIRYQIDLYETDLTDLSWSPEEKRKMAQNDKTSKATKMLESLLMKMRKYERTHVIKYHDNRKASRKIRGALKRKLKRSKSDV